MNSSIRRPYFSDNSNDHRRPGSKTKDKDVVIREVRRWQYFNCSNMYRIKSDFDWYPIYYWPWVMVDNALIDHPNQLQRLNLFLFFVSNGMNSHNAAENVMRDRVGMDRAAYNQINSLRDGSYKNMEYSYWDMHLYKYVTHYPENEEKKFENYLIK